MVLLAVASVVIGFVANPPIDLGIVPKHWMSGFVPLGLGEALKADVFEHLKEPEFNMVIAVIANAVALAGVGLAYAMYHAKWLSAEAVGRRFKWIYVVLFRKYYFDEAYEGVLVNKGIYKALAGTLDWTDRNVVDRTVNTVGWVGRNSGKAIGKIQNGQMQTYAVGMGIGILVIFGVYMVWG